MKKGDERYKDVQDAADLNYIDSRTLAENVQR